MKIFRDLIETGFVKRERDQTKQYIHKVHWNARIFLATCNGQRRFFIHVTKRETQTAVSI